MIRSRDSERGITLLELMVVLLIVALLAGALTVGYARLPATAMRREGVRLAAVLRSAYDKATASGAHHRVVLELDDGTYRIERCEGRIQVRKSRDLQEEVERQRVEAEKETIFAGMQSGDQITQSMVAEAGKKLGSTKCEPVKGELGKAQALGGHPRVSFSKVLVGHLEEPAQKGEVTINFFPLGTAERAVIELRVGEEDHFTVTLHPLSGRIELAQGEMRPSDDAVTEDAEGKHIE